jgi:hypothetical protein
MTPKLAVLLFAIMLTASVLTCGLPTVAAQDANLTYKLLDQADGSVSYTLNVVVSQSLNEYYHGLSHDSASDADFLKFATPDAVKPIADALRQVYPDDEDFANGVLMLVHQIPYEGTIPAFYPVETLSVNKGDCDMFSLLAASILEAGGLQVILLHYTSAAHMNLGIHLESSPKDARQGVYFFEDNGAPYYVAESTSTNWIEGWRVGECPDDIKNTPMQVIMLDNMDAIAPSQVFASLEKLKPATLSIKVSPTFATEGSTVILTGQITPAMPNENITLYYSANGGSWSRLSSTLTQANGNFTYSWKPETYGELNVRASWAGNFNYAKTTSEAKNTTIMALHLVALSVVATISIIIFAVTFVATRKRRKKRRLNEEGVSVTNTI